MVKIPEMNQSEIVKTSSKCFYPNWYVLVLWASSSTVSVIVQARKFQTTSIEHRLLSQRTLAPELMDAAFIKAKAMTLVAENPEFAATLSGTRLGMAERAP